MKNIISRIMNFTVVFVKLTAMAIPFGIVIVLASGLLCKAIGIH